MTSLFFFPSLDFFLYFEFGNLALDCKFELCLELLLSYYPSDVERIDEWQNSWGPDHWMAFLMTNFTKSWIKSTYHLSILHGALMIYSISAFSCSFFLRNETELHFVWPWCWVLLLSLQFSNYIYFVTWFFCPIDPAKCQVFFFNLRVHGSFWQIRA